MNSDQTKNQVNFIYFTSQNSPKLPKRGCE